MSRLKRLISLTLVAFLSLPLSSAMAQIALQESIRDSVDSGTQVVLPSWTPGSNELVLVGIGVRNETGSPPWTVSGNGLTFVKVDSVLNTQGQNGVWIFRAMGASPSTGSITVTSSVSTAISVMAARFSGIDTGGTNGSAAVEADSTNPGPDDPPGDDDDMMADITTLSADAWVVGVGTSRLATFTVPGGETGIEINVGGGSGGDETYTHMWYQAATTAGTYTLGAANDLSSARDWCMVLVSVKKAAAAGAAGLYRGQTITTIIN